MHLDTFKTKHSLPFICVCIESMSSGTKRILCNHIVYALEITTRILKILPYLLQLSVKSLLVLQFVLL